MNTKYKIIRKLVQRKYRKKQNKTLCPIATCKLQKKIDGMFRRDLCLEENNNLLIEKRKFHSQTRETTLH